MSKWARRAIFLVAAVLMALATWLAVAALFLHPSNTGERAAQFQALGAAGALVASIVLVAVTAIYVTLTGDMVREARDARLDAVRPALVLRLDGVGPVHSFFSLVNAGQGTAVDIDVTLTFHALVEGGHEHVVRWRAPSLAPQAHAQFMPKDATGMVELETEKLVGMFSKVTVKGSLKDVAGRSHNVEVSLDDLPGWRALLAAAGQRYERDYLKQIADALETIEKKLP